MSLLMSSLRSHRSQPRLNLVAQLVAVARGPWDTTPLTASPVAMETSPCERLALLFNDQSLNQPGQTEPDSADDEPAITTASKTEPGITAASKTEPGITAASKTEPAWEIPVTAKSPRKVHGQQPKPAAGEEVSSSEEEDDYVAAFQSKSRAERRPKRQLVQKAAGPSSHESQPSSDFPDRDDQGNAALGHFCRLALVAKFPYKYVKDSSNEISRQFFANQKFYQRTWDLYYLHPVQASASSQPILLLPYSQVKALLDEISATFNIDVSVPPAPFTLSFFDDGTPQPVFLGRTSCRADINELQDSIPAPSPGYGEPPANASEVLSQAFARFKIKVDKVPSSSRKGKKGSKKIAENDRFLQSQDVNKQLRRVQRYFGLRPEPYRLQNPPPGLSWEDQSIFIQEEEKKATTALEALDLAKASPHDFLGEPIIVAIDVESYERAHELVTEVGVSTLDTLDLVGLEPGKNGEVWMQKIRSRHFRIKGREIYINKDFCIGDGNAFDFGQSEWIDLDKIGDAIDSCFEWPFSALCIYSSAQEQKGARERRILLVGHALHADLAYLSKLNSAVFSAPRELTTTMQLSSQEQLTTSDPRALKGARICDRVIECLDTSKLYKGLMHEDNIRSLVSIMVEVDRPASNPHNSGNDARYTLEALVGIAIKSRLMDDAAEAQESKPDNLGDSVGQWPLMADGALNDGGTQGGSKTTQQDTDTPSRQDTYRIAHTARCKLQQAANRPDRDLRFILGHAFTLDNLLLRIVEIENSRTKAADDNGDDEVEKASLSTDSDSDEDYDPEAFAISLQRFASASARQPRQVRCEEVPDLDEDEDDESGPPSPPTLPEEVTRKMVNEGEEDERMHGLYNDVRNCHCRQSHRQAPVSKGMKTGVYEGRRVGVIKVE
ncbi:hypothetical protein DV735_g2384, partial [Chaetothyriales sp. CBS 134920]